ncbi:MAG TPA: DUF3126 family protein [Aliidongia sp.]|nr:DUF3126 family protein [Aliidongia sp.]
MTPNDVARVQDYLRRTFSNDRIAIDLPTKRGAPVEVRIADEFIGVLHRDDEDDDGSWSLIITILDEDLPPASPVGVKPPRK